MKKLILPFLLISTLASADITVTNISAEKNNDKIHYEYTFPQFKFNGKELDYINSEFKDRINILSEEGTQKDNYEDILEERVSYDKFDNTFGITSVVLYDYIYSGGAHGMTALSEINIDDKTGEKLSFDDIFKTGFKEKLENDILQIIKNNKDEDVVYFGDIENVDLDSAIFYFEGNDLVIKFSSYAIAPYSSGYPEFRFSKEQIKKYLNK